MERSEEELREALALAKSEFQRAMLADDTFFEIFKKIFEYLPDGYELPRVTCEPMILVKQEANGEQVLNDSYMKSTKAEGMTPIGFLVTFFNESSSSPRFNEESPRKYTAATIVIGFVNDHDDEFFFNGQFLEQVADSLKIQGMASDDTSVKDEARRLIYLWDNQQKKIASFVDGETVTIDPQLGVARLASDIEETEFTFSDTNRPVESTPETVEQKLSKAKQQFREDMFENETFASIVELVEVMSGYSSRGYNLDTCEPVLLPIDEKLAKIGVRLTHTKILPDIKKDSVPTHVHTEDVVHIYDLDNASGNKVISPELIAVIRHIQRATDMPDDTEEATELAIKLAEHWEVCSTKITDQFGDDVHISPTTGLFVAEPREKFTKDKESEN